jgi:thiamine-monophosphate kinase
MPPGEFELINRHFMRRGAARDDVRVGVGDDAAVVAARPGSELVLALDTVVAGAHFPPELDARLVGHRVLAVNLSDLAAMGADPAWALLGLTLPSAEERWLTGFSAGLDALAQRFDVELVGGDTTRGPLSATIALAGFVPSGQALRRRGARPGDDIWVSGTPGTGMVPRKRAGSTPCFSNAARHASSLSCSSHESKRAPLLYASSMTSHSERSPRAITPSSQLPSESCMRKLT